MYDYIAYTPSGTEQRGRLDAPTRLVALELLIQQGLVPVLLDVCAHRSARRIDLRRFLQRQADKAIPHHELLATLDSLSSLLRSGLPVDRALFILQLSRDGAIGAWIRSLLQSIRSGNPLSEALRTSGRRLPGYVLSLVEAGEASGALPTTLRHICDLMSQQEQFQQRVRSALVYPTLIGFMLATTMVVLMTVVLPRFESMFSETQGSLPLATSIMLAVSRWMSHYGWYALLGGTVVAVAATAWARSTLGQKHLERWLLTSKLSLGLPLLLNSSRWLRVLGTLLEGGQTLPMALKVARGTLTLATLQGCTDDIARRVQAGESFADALLVQRRFPSVVVQLAHVGEETGQLPPLLAAAAQSLETTTQRLLDRVLAIGVPLLTIFMGGLVAAMVGAVMLGLLSLNELAF